MSLLKNLFGKKEDAEPTSMYDPFWKWFQQHEKTFFNVVKERQDIEKEFFDKMSVKLNEIREGFYFLTGMAGEDTVELVVSAEGLVKNIPFAEDLVLAAPAIAGWKFTALKPAFDITNMSIKMAGYEFSKENISFYANEHEDFPDLIDIVVVNHDLTEENRQAVGNGTFTFIDNCIGELNFTTNIDYLNIAGKHEATKELIPIEKLGDYLVWRQKEFVEKYEDARHDTENDRYAMMEATLQNGNPLLAVINTDLLEWDGKASHPWILEVSIPFDGENNNGMPDTPTYKQMDAFEDELLQELTDTEGHLNIGRQTADSMREIYFACKDFRKASRVLHAMQQKYAGKLQLNYDLYKDKYWRSFNRFRNTDY